MKSKKLFDTFFNNYFKGRGLDNAVDTMLPLLETTAHLSEREKLVLRGLNYFFNLQGASISRILNVGNKKMDHDYANRLLREYSQEENQINIKIKTIKKEDFVKMLQEYLGVESIEVMIEIIYGLNIVGGFRHKYIAKIVKGMSGNLADMDRVKVKNACKSLKKLGWSLAKWSLKVCLALALRRYL